MRTVLTATLTLTLAASAQAQFPPEKLENLKVFPKDIPVRALIDTMAGFTRALGVRCTFCHVGEEGKPLSTYDFKSDEKHTKEAARVMLGMVAAINGAQLGKLEHRHEPRITVTCATCHRGVAIPRPLAEVLMLTGLRDGADAAVAQYRELRTRDYGRGAYDFGEETLLSAARRLGQSRPELAIPLAELNLEFFPKSVNSLVVKAIAQSRRDEEGAIATLKQALEIEPNNGEIKGRLYQLEETLARRKKFANPQ